jgi:serine/threonine protein kinase
MGDALSPKKGQIYGKWKLKSLLGQGGNGFVWSAEHNGQEVAIKILAKLDGKSSKVYERFKREVKVIQENTDIEGIIHILDSFLPNDPIKEYPWYVMPKAIPIETFLEKASTEQKILWIIAIGKTLIELHERGISHRDIKPANILVKADGKPCLADFGLVDQEDGLDLTSKGEQLGAKWTIAPEMKRSSYKADGKPADVYSLAKTLWILLSGIKEGFDGQYDPDSNNGIKQVFLKSPYGVKDEPVYKKPLDDLLAESTDNDPYKRPKIRAFVERLNHWLKICKEYQRYNPLEWRDIQKKLFPAVVPQRAIWVRKEDIISVLNILASTNSLGHMFLPQGGGRGFGNASIGHEEDTIELARERGGASALIIKPKRLIFESFGLDWEWNYFRLETNYLDPIGVESGNCKPGYHYEELVEIHPREYIDRMYWDYGEYDGQYLPDEARLVFRYVKGDFVIFQKTSIYNRIRSTYDGRHNKMDTELFRKYIAKLCEESKRLRAIPTENDEMANETIANILEFISTNDIE